MGVPVNSVRFSGFYLDSFIEVALHGKVPSECPRKSLRGKNGIHCCGTAAHFVRRNFKSAIWAIVVIYTGGEVGLHFCRDRGGETVLGKRHVRF